VLASIAPKDGANRMRQQTGPIAVRQKSESIGGEHGEDERRCMLIVRDTCAGACRLPDERRSDWIQIAF